MTPQETARELINKFRRITDEKGLRAIKLEYAKQCALITVDELIEEAHFTDDYYDRQEYWEEVKKEIEKL